jgi:hypothetical protein
MSQNKAQLAVSGYSPDKGCNTVLAHMWAFLRGRREAVAPQLSKRRVYCCDYAAL